MGQRERKIDIVNMPKSGYLQRNQMFTAYRRMNVGTLVYSSYKNLALGRRFKQKCSMTPANASV
jgi:hypothetical protein